MTGHGLVAEGAAHRTDANGKFERVVRDSVRGTGMAVCACGAVSPVFDSSAKRKNWHREHKKSIAGGTGSQVPFVCAAPERTQR